MPATTAPATTTTAALCRLSIVAVSLAVAAGCGSGGGGGGPGNGGTGNAPGSGNASGTGNAPGSGGAPGNGTPRTGGAPGNGTPGTGGGPGGNLPGVVIVDGTAMCRPLCTTVTTPTTADPNWSYENGYSCVLPQSVLGKNQKCTTGQPLPAAESRPGVVIVDGTPAAARCVPLCQVITTPNDPTAPDWSYENNSSCILPNSVTGKNQKCMTLQPVPPPAQRPGILLVTSGADTGCVPLCAVSTTPSSTTAPDWSYENNAACVLPASPTATGRRTCTAFGPAPSFVPPALTGTKVAGHTGFYVSNGRLLDVYGHEFVIRGVDNAHLWFDTAANYLAWGALDNLAGYGVNAIRVVWDTTTLAGAPAVSVPAPASLLAEDLFRIVELKMIPIVEIHSTTGVNDPATLMAAAQYFVRPEVKKVLLDFQEYVLINIGNEWNGTGTYVSAYTSAINLLRQNGLNHVLVIDANGSGQIVQSAGSRTNDINTWFTNAGTLLQADPQHNLMFSVHMYEQYTTLANVTEVLGHAGVGSTVALMVGEFGISQNGVNVDWQDIMAESVRRNIGYMAWSWFGNGGTTMQLNMAAGWEGPLTTWGAGVLTQGPNSVQSTAAKASIFP